MGGGRAIDPASLRSCRRATPCGCGTLTTGAAQHSPADLLARPDGGDNLPSQIRRLLGRDCNHWPDLEALAHQLNTSPQTLRRHLREQGSSFQELKDQLRRDLAIYHLGRHELPIQDIAEQLGFSEPSAFHRAFKKWTGLTPGAYRAQEN